MRELEATRFASRRNSETQAAAEKCNSNRQQPREQCSTCVGGDGGGGLLLCRDALEGNLGVELIQQIRHDSDEDAHADDV